MPYKDPEKQRETMRAAGRKHYAANREKIIAKQTAYNRELRRAKRDMLNSYKSCHPCVDCGVLYPPYVMEFDHVPGRGVKRGNISELSNGQISFKKLLAEMEKCDLLCANCHRIRTFGRMAKS